MLGHLPVVLAQVSLFDPKGMLFPILATLVIFYLLVLRPQQKQQKETQSLLSSLKKGDDVVTSGGVLGRVHLVDEKVVTLDLGGGTKMRVLKQSIQSRVTVEPPKTEAKGDAGKDAGEAKKEEK